jgi:hypothetical protein
LAETEGDNFMWTDIADRSFGEVKIVGNIFENPEYMKEKNTRFQKHESLEQVK